jgi:hypothetical protein
MSVPALFTFGAFRTTSVAALLMVSVDLAEENRLALRATEKNYPRRTIF